MLGFAPIAASPIAGGGFSLVEVEAPISASISFTFGGGAAAGIFAPISATATFTFAGSATWNTLNAISATATVTFGGSPNLTLAGRPIRITAMAERFTVSADKYSYATTALPDSLTVKGVPE